MVHVNRAPRRYDSSGRQAQALRNRTAILDSAERQFLETGYAATTLAAIAKGAGVSVETIYKVFGGKSGLVRAIYERGLTGQGQVPAFTRSDKMRERETDPAEIMRNWGILAAEVAALGMPIRQLIRSSAATDPEMSSLLESSDNDRLERARHHADFLADHGYLREGISLDQATDVLWTCTSVEIYELLVLKRGWSLPQFAEFIADFMITGLLTKPG